MCFFFFIIIIFECCIYSWSGFQISRDILYSPRGENVKKVGIESFKVLLEVPLLFSVFRDIQNSCLNGVIDSNTPV